MSSAAGACLLNLLCCRVNFSIALNDILRPDGRQKLQMQSTIAPSMPSRRRLQHFAQIASLFAVVSLLVLSLWILHDSSNVRAGNATTDKPSTFPIIPPTSQVEHTEAEKPAALSPQDLMSRPLSADRTHVPKLLHQSWKNSTVPDRFKAWSQTCRTTNSDWEYVLWTDDDNALMVKKYAPWFLNTFNDLPEPIERADASRNLYMHIFGGVYADLDTECLRPYNSLFANHSVPPVSHKEIALDNSHLIEPSTQRKAFLGQMHEDRTFHSGLPNAWMASTPAHPFWTLPLEYISTHVSDSKTPEFLTGPDALFDIVKSYNKKYASKASAVLDKHHENSVWSQIHNADPDTTVASPPQSLEVLAPLNIFPFNWADVPLRRVCWAGQPKFDAETCKDVLDVERLGSYSISYFGHSWDGDPFYSE